MASHELALRLFIRDVSAQYRQSLLGIFWAFLPPIITGLVFIILQSKRVVNFGETDIPYPVYAIVGTTLWQLFSESISAPLQSVEKARSMLSKINFPREALFVSAFYQMVLSTAIKSVIIAGILIAFEVQVTLGLLLAPVAVLVIILLGMSVGIFLTPIGTLYSDIQRGLLMIMQLWFFVTPVVYPPPQSFPYSLIATVNPVSPILIGARDLITKGELDNMCAFLITACLTLVALLISWLLYRVSLPIIVERMSA